MAKLIITVQAPTRVRLSRFYLLIREIVDYFGLDSDVSVELEDA